MTRAVGVELASQDLPKEEALSQLYCGQYIDTTVAINRGATQLITRVTQGVMGQA